jgi:FkbM family methyltransferase
MSVEMNADSLIREAKRTIRSFCPQPILNWREAQFFGKYGEVELHIVGYLCRRAKDSFDIGANNGSYVHFMRPHSRRVFAFEPIPWMAAELARKFPRGVEVKTIALSREAGSAVLRMPILDGKVILGCSSVSEEASAVYAEHQEIPVRLEPLDAIYGGDAGFVKIDVEGHEEAVLDGAWGTIRRSRPRILVEIEERLNPGGIGRIAERFGALDYRGYFIHDGKMRPIESFDIGRLQRDEDLPDLSISLDKWDREHRYFCNFLFIPAEEPAETLCKIEHRLSQL